MANEITVILGQKFRDGQEDQLRKRIRSLIRMTYRRDFPMFDPYGITSDSGWGCMLRSAQTLMANVMIHHFFGKEWRLPTDRKDIISNQQYLEILKWFVDLPGVPHYFALHHMVQCGIKYSKLPGEWYGPSTVALVLRDIADLQRRSYDGPLAVYVTNGDTVYYDDVNKLCEPTSNESPSQEAEKEEFFDPLVNVPPSLPKIPWECSLLVLLPLRLGIDKVNDEYYDELKEVLEHEKCAGILGGRPNHALFFAGYNSNNQILGLDPHTTYASTVVDDQFPRDEYLSQIHVNNLEKMDFSRLDPSLTIAFYFRDRNEFEYWYDEVNSNNEAKIEAGNTPLFHVGKTAPNYMSCDYQDELDGNEDMEGDETNESRRQSHTGSFKIYEQDDDDEDDYVILADFK